MITQFKIYEGDFRKSSDYYIGRFIVDTSLTNTIEIKLIQNILGAYIKYGMYMLSGYKIRVGTYLNNNHIGEPDEFRWEGDGDSFKRFKILSINELFKTYPEICEKLYLKVKGRHIKHPGLVRYTKFLEVLETSTNLMAYINANKYNL